MLLLYLFVAALGCTLVNTVPDEESYCENEIMRASCAPDEVVVMGNATYGRMRLSRCIDRNYGYIGCSVDVLEDADRKCSGKRSCEIRVPNPEFSASNACPRDLKPYLLASYTCRKVVTPVEGQCRPRSSVTVGGSGGTLASVVTMETGVGVAECPWVIQARKGQTINVTLHDFGRAQRNSEICHAYAILRETDPPQRLTVCNGVERTRHVYTTMSNILEIRVLGSNKGRHFLLEYTINGCPDLDNVAHMWFRRSAAGQTAKVGCKGTDMSWDITCVRNTWQGQVENCSQVLVGSVIQHEGFGINSMPFGFSVAMIIIIALVIGVVFMILGLMCLKWRRKSCMPPSATPHPDSYYSEYPHDNKSLDSRRYIKRELPWPPAESDTTSYNGENEYSYIADLPLPPTVGHQDYADPPKYFVLETELAGNGSRGRYVPSQDGHRRTSNYTPSSLLDQSRHDFVYPYRDEVSMNNHVSV